MAAHRRPAARRARGSGCGRGRAGGRGSALTLRVVWNAILHDARPSGANRRRAELLKALLALGADVEVTLVLRRGVAAPAEHPRLRIARANVAASPAAMRAVGESIELRSIARAASADAVMHESFPVPALGKRPIVLTVHDLRALEPGARAASIGRRLIAPAWIRRGLERAARVVAVSEFTRGAVLRAAAIDPARVAVVPNAADHLAPPGRLPLREPALVLAVGHLEARKGSDLLVEAFARLHRRIPSASLRLAGSGPLAKTLAARVRALDLGSAVTIEPAANDAELARLYATATVVAVPSRYEGFCIPLLEAMRCGAPVLAADASALPEVAGGAARLVAGFEPDAWAAALEDVVFDARERERLAAKGVARAAEFTWRASARAMLGVLTAAAASGARSTGAERR